MKHDRVSANEQLDLSGEEVDFDLLDAELDLTSTTGEYLSAELAARRVQALAHLAPLHDLERDKNMGRSGRDWDVYDTRLLTITAIDAVVAGTGLHAAAGTPRANVIEALERQAERCAPDRPRSEHVEVAEWVLDRLLNIREASRSHEVDYVDVLDGYAHTILDVRLLYELPDPEHDVVVVADTAAVNLLVVALDHDIADAQIAAEAMLQAQLESNRLGPAIRSAQLALQASRGYRTTIRQALRTARQDLRQIDWVEQVEPQLAEALEHIAGRLKFEKALRKHAQAVSLDPEADRQMSARASRIVALLDEAIQTLSSLSNELIDAREVFRTEQNRQSFAPPAPITLRDPRADILEPFARLPADQADRVTDVLHECFLDHQETSLLTFGPLVGTLTAQPRPAPEPQPDTDDELVDLDPVFRQFAEDTWDASDRILDTVDHTPTRLSDLLNRTRESDDARKVALLTALRCLRVFDADAGRSTSRATSGAAADLTAADDGTELDTPWLLGPDLLVQRPTTRPDLAGNP